MKKIEEMFFSLFASLVGGLWRFVNVKDFEKMFGQPFLLGYLVGLCYPIFEGIITLKSKGRS